MATQPSNQVLKAVKSLHKQWAKQLKSKTHSEVEEVVKYCQDDAFMLLGGGIDSLAKGLQTRDADLKKTLLKVLRSFLLPHFHEEANKHTELRPSVEHTRRALAFLAAAITNGSAYAGAGAIIPHFESPEAGTVELALSTYRAVTAAFLSLPFSSKSRVTFVEAQASAAVSPSQQQPGETGASPLLTLAKYIEQAAVTFDGVTPTSGVGVAGHQGDLSLGDTSSSSLAAAPPAGGRATTKGRNAGGMLPDPSLVALPSTPTIIGTLEALRILHLLAVEALSPDRSVHVNPSYDVLLKHAHIATSAPAVSAGNSSSSSGVTSNSISAGSGGSSFRSTASSSKAGGSTASRTSTGGGNVASSTPTPPTSYTAASISASLRHAICLQIPRMLPGLISLAQVRGVELENEPNAKAGTLAIRAAASLVLADFTWVLCGTSTIPTGTATASIQISSQQQRGGASSSSSSAGTFSVFESAARTAMLGSIPVLTKVAAKALEDATNNVHGAILRFALEQSGAVTANGDTPLPPPAPAISHSSAGTHVSSAAVSTVAAPTPSNADHTKPPAAKGAASVVGVAGSSTTNNSKQAAATQDLHAHSSANRVGAHAMVVIGAELGLESGQYEQTCQFLLSTTLRIGEEKTCWSAVNDPVGTITANVVKGEKKQQQSNNMVTFGGSIEDINLTNGPIHTGPVNSTFHHQQDTATSSFSFSVASLETAYTHAAHATSALIRICVAAPFIADEDLLEPRQPVQRSGSPPPPSSLSSSASSSSSHTTNDRPASPPASLSLPEPRIPTWYIIIQNIIALLSIPESPHKHETTRLLSLLLVRMTCSDDRLRVAICAAGVLPLLGARMRDPHVDARTSDISEGALHVLLSFVPGALGSSNNNGTNANSNNRGSGFSAIGAGAKLALSEQKHGDEIDSVNHASGGGEGSNHHDDAEGGLSTLHGNPNDATCIPLTRSTTSMASSDYVNTITSLDAPSSFARRSVDARVLIADAAAVAAASAAASAVGLNTNGNDSTGNAGGAGSAAADMKSPAKGGAAAVGGKAAPAGKKDAAASAAAAAAATAVASAPSEDTYALIPEPSLPAGLTRATPSNSIVAVHGPWLGTVDIAAFLCYGYPGAKGVSSASPSSSALPQANGPPTTPSAGSRPPSRSAGATPATSATAEATSVTPASLPPVAAPSTVFEHICPDVSAFSFPVWNLPLEHTTPVSPWLPVPVGTGQLYMDPVEYEALMNNHLHPGHSSGGAPGEDQGHSNDADAASVAASKAGAGSVKAASVAGKSVAPTSTAAGGAKKGTTPAPAAGPTPTPLGATPGIPGASTVAHSMLSGATHAGENTKLGMALIAKFFLLLTTNVPQTTGEVVAVAASTTPATTEMDPKNVWIARLRGLRLVASFMQIAQENTSIRDTLLGARIPALTARLAVDAIASAYRVPAAVMNLAGSMAPLAVSAAQHDVAAVSASATPTFTSSIVGTSSTAGGGVPVKDMEFMDTLLQSLLLSLQILQLCLQFPYGGAADVASALSELGPIVPDSIIAAALHSQVLIDTLPALKEAVQTIETKIAAAKQAKISASRRGGGMNNRQSFGSSSHANNEGKWADGDDDDDDADFGGGEEEEEGEEEEGNYSDEDDEDEQGNDGGWGNNSSATKSWGKLPFRTDGFIIPVHLIDPRNALGINSFLQQAEVCELRAWCLHVLRSFAASDRQLRSYEYGVPATPIPGRDDHGSSKHDALGDAGKAGGKKGTAPGPAAAAKDAGGKKPTAAPVTATGTPSGSSATVSSVFKSPSHPPSGSPVVGVDWDCKTESVGERLAASVLRHVPMLIAAMSHASTASGMLPFNPHGGASGLTANHASAVLPSAFLTGSAVRIHILRLIDESLTIYRARDKLASAVLSTLREYCIVSASLQETAKNHHHGQESSPSVVVTATLEAAQRIFGARSSTIAPVPAGRGIGGGKNTNSLLIYGCLATLVLGKSTGFNAQLHTLASAGGNNITSTAASSAAAAAANASATPAAAAATDKKGAAPAAATAKPAAAAAASAKPGAAAAGSAAGKGNASTISTGGATDQHAGAPSSEIYASIMAARKSWRHPVEGWYELPSSQGVSQVEDILSLHTSSSGEGGSGGDHFKSQAGVLHSIDRFCVDGRPFYVGLGGSVASDAGGDAGGGNADGSAHSHDASRPSTTATTTKPAAPAAGAPAKGGKATTGPATGSTEHTSTGDEQSSSSHMSPQIPDIFTLPTYMWPVGKNAHTSLSGLFTVGGEKTHTPTTSIIDMILQLAQSSITAAYPHATGFAEHAATIPEHQAHILYDASRGILTSFVLALFLQPFASSLCAYLDPIPSEVEMLMGLRIISRFVIDPFRGTATQTATAEVACAEALRAGMMLYTLSLVDAPPVPIEVTELPNTPSIFALYGVRGATSAGLKSSGSAVSLDKMFLWKHAVILGPFGRAMLKREAQTLMNWIRNRPEMRSAHWGRIPTRRTRHFSPEETSAIQTLGEHPDWSTLPEGLVNVDVAAGTVVEEALLGRDDPLYPAALDALASSVAASESHDPHSTTTPDAPSSSPHIVLTTPAPLTRASIDRRRHYFSSIITGPLLDMPARVGRLGGSLLSPLFAAIMLDADEELISSFLANGAFVDIRRGEDAVTPLMAALAAGKLQVASALIAGGADVNARDKVGNPVVKYAFLPTQDADKRDIQALEADRTAACVTLPLFTVYGRSIVMGEADLAAHTTRHNKYHNASWAAAGRVSNHSHHHHHQHHHHHHPNATTTVANGSSQHESAAAATATTTITAEEPPLGNLKEMFGASAAIVQRMARRMILRRRLDVARRSLRDTHSLRSHIPVVFSSHSLMMEAIMLLINKDADIAACDAGGNSVLHWLVAGAFLMDPPVRTKSCRYVPVFHAPFILNDQVRKLMDVILSNGARIDAVNNRGAAPLHCALECGKMSFAIHLVKLGADTAIADKLGCLPMHYAALGRGFHGKHAGITRVHESEPTDFDKELNAAAAALGDEQKVGEHMARARIVSPRAEFFLDMVLRALQHGREVDGKYMTAKGKAAAAKAAAAAAAAAHSSSKEMDGDDAEEVVQPHASMISQTSTIAGLNGGPSQRPQNLLHPLTPADILLHSNRYGITPLHVAAGANIDGTLSLTLRQGGTSSSMPTTFTGVHPLLLTLARHGSAVRAAGITVRAVNFTGVEETIPHADGADASVEETFIMVVINRNTTAEFLFSCADETAARADIVYTALGLPDVLSGARAIVSEVRGMRADDQLRSLLGDCMTIYENRRGNVAATKVVSRESVQAATDAAMALAYSHAQALVSATCNSGRNALHYTALSWHSPLQELIGAGAKTLLTPSPSTSTGGHNQGAASGASSSSTATSNAAAIARAGITTALNEHYSSCWRIVRYLQAAARGTLSTPVMREATTIEAWRRANPRGIRTLAYLPSRADDADGYTDADTLPYPGVAFVQRVNAVKDASSCLMISDGIAKAKAKAAAAAAAASTSNSPPSKKQQHNIDFMNSPDASSPSPASPQGSTQLADVSILSAGSGQGEARRKAALMEGANEDATAARGGAKAQTSSGFTPLGYSLAHLHTLSTYATALTGLDAADLGLALPARTSNGSSSPSSSSSSSSSSQTSSIILNENGTVGNNEPVGTPGYHGEVFVPAGLGPRGIVESASWALAALGLLNFDPELVVVNVNPYSASSMFGSAAIGGGGEAETGGSSSSYISESKNKEEEDINVGRNNRPVVIVTSSSSSSSSSSLLNRLKIPVVGKSSSNTNSTNGTRGDSKDSGNGEGGVDFSPALLETLKRAVIG